MKTPRDFMLDDLEDGQAQEEWWHYLDNMIATAEKREEDDEDGE